MTDYPQDKSEHPQSEQPYGKQPSYDKQPSLDKQTGDPLPSSAPQPPPFSGPAPTPPGQFPGQPPAYGYPAQAVSPADARMWSLFAHLGATFLSFFVPLVIYLVYKDRDPFIRRHSAQALNFHITLAIIYLVSIPLLLVGVGFLTIFAAAICSLVFSIIAAVAANDGREYTYPLTPTMIT